MSKEEVITNNICLSFGHIILYDKICNGGYDILKFLKLLQSSNITNIFYLNKEIFTDEVINEILNNSIKIYNSYKPYIELKGNNSFSNDLNKILESTSEFEKIKEYFNEIKSKVEGNFTKYFKELNLTYKKTDIITIEKELYIQAYFIKKVYNLIKNYDEIIDDIVYTSNTIQKFERLYDNNYINIDNTKTIYNMIVPLIINNNHAISISIISSNIIDGKETEENKNKYKIYISDANYGIYLCKNNISLKKFLDILYQILLLLIFNDNKTDNKIFLDEKIIKYIIDLNIDDEKKEYEFITDGIYIQKKGTCTVSNYLNNMLLVDKYTNPEDINSERYNIQLDFLYYKELIEIINKYIKYLDSSEKKDLEYIKTHKLLFNNHDIDKISTEYDYYKYIIRIINENLKILVLIKKSLIGEINKKIIDEYDKIYNDLYKVYNNLLNKNINDINKHIKLINKSKIINNDFIEQISDREIKINNNIYNTNLSKNYKDLINLIKKIEENTNEYEKLQQYNYISNNIMKIYNLITIYLNDRFDYEDELNRFNKKSNNNNIYYYLLNIFNNYIIFQQQLSKIEDLDRKKKLSEHKIYFKYHKIFDIIKYITNGLIKFKRVEKIDDELIKDITSKLKENLEKYLKSEGQYYLIYGNYYTEGLTFSSRGKIEISTNVRDIDIIEKKNNYVEEDLETLNENIIEYLNKEEFIEIEENDLLTQFILFSILSLSYITKNNFLFVNIIYPLICNPNLINFNIIQFNKKKEHLYIDLDSIYKLKKYNEEKHLTTNFDCIYPIEILNMNKNILQYLYTNSLDKTYKNITNNIYTINSKRFLYNNLYKEYFFNITLGFSFFKFYYNLINSITFSNPNIQRTIHEIIHKTLKDNNFDLFKLVINYYINNQYFIKLSFLENDLIEEYKNKKTILLYLKNFIKIFENNFYINEYEDIKNNELKIITNTNIIYLLLYIINYLYNLKENNFTEYEYIIIEIKKEKIFEKILDNINIFINYNLNCEKYSLNDYYIKCKFDYNLFKNCSFIYNDLYMYNFYNNRFKNEKLFNLLIKDYNNIEIYEDKEFLVSNNCSIKYYIPKDDYKENLNQFFIINNKKYILTNDIYEFKINNYSFNLYKLEGFTKNINENYFISTDILINNSCPLIILYNTEEKYIKEIIYEDNIYVIVNTILYYNIINLYILYNINNNRYYILYINYENDKKEHILDHDHYIEQQVIIDFYIIPLNNNLLTLNKNNSINYDKLNLSIIDYYGDFISNILSYDCIYYDLINNKDKDTTYIDKYKYCINLDNTIQEELFELHKNILLDLEKEIYINIDKDKDIDIFKKLKEKKIYINKLLYIIHNLFYFYPFEKLVKKIYYIFDILHNYNNIYEEYKNKTIKNIDELKTKLLQVKENINTIKNIDKFKFDKSSDEEIKKYKNIIIIYIKLFECFSGYNIRDNQYDIIINIINEIYEHYIINNNDDKTLKNISNYKIYQLLMGSGKSSVIAPLVCLLINQLFNMNIIYVLPEHLINEAYYKNFSKINFLFKNHLYYYNKNIKNDILINNNLIISDTDFKYLYFINKQKIDYKNTFILIDEIDYIINSLRLDYNIVNTEENIKKNLIEIIEYIFKYDFNNDGNKLNVLINKTFGTTSYNIETIKNYNIFNDFMFSSINIFNIVPCEKTNKPIEGSRFNNIIDEILLTIKAYKYYKDNQRKYDINYYNKNTNNLIINYDKERDKIDYEIKDYDKIPEKEYINYISNIIENNIKITTSYYNINLLDVINGNISYYKSGFSGTKDINYNLSFNDKNNDFDNIVNINEKNNLIFNNPFINDEEGNKKIENIFEEHISKFENIKEINENNIMYDNFINYIVNNNINCVIDTFGFFKDKQNIEIINDIKNKLQIKQKQKQIQKQLQKEQHKEQQKIQLQEEQQIQEKKIKNNTYKYIYIDDNDNIIIIINGISKIYINGDIKENDEVIIIIDHKHTVGLDIILPKFNYNFNICEIINDKTTFDGFNQSTYRIRKINEKGYYITIYNVDNKNEINNQEKLKEYLLYNQERIFNNKQYIMFIQNFRTLLRTNQNKEDLIDKNYLINYGKDIINNDGNINIMLMNIIKDNIIDKKIKEKLELIVNYLNSKKKELLIQKSIIKEKEKEKEHEKVEETVKNYTEFKINKNKLLLSFNNNSLLSHYLDKFNFDVYYYTALYIFLFKSILKKHYNIDCDELILNKIKTYLYHHRCKILYHNDLEVYNCDEIIQDNNITLLYNLLSISIFNNITLNKNILNFFENNVYDSNINKIIDNYKKIDIQIDKKIDKPEFKHIFVDEDKEIFKEKCNIYNSLISKKDRKIRDRIISQYYDKYKNYRIKDYKDRPINSFIEQEYYYTYNKSIIEYLEYNKIITNILLIYENTDLFYYFENIYNINYKNLYLALIDNYIIKSLKDISITPDIKERIINEINKVNILNGGIINKNYLYFLKYKEIKKKYLLLKYK